MNEEHRPAGWFETDDGQLDYLFSTQPGAVSRQSSVHLAGRQHPIDVLASMAVYVQISPEVAQELAADAALSTLFRRSGVGRVRKDGSTPLEPPADRIWIQSLDGDAVLVWRQDPQRADEATAFFRLGQLPGDVVLVGHASYPMAQVFFVVANDFLPAASSRHLDRIVAEKDAFGALVACTGEG